MTRVRQYGMYNIGPNLCTIAPYLFADVSIMWVGVQEYSCRDRNCEFHYTSLIWSKL